MIKSINIIAKGLVQGVFFRKTMKDNADKFGLFGFVQNNLDQSVYIEVEGEESKIGTFIANCWLGSSKSEVEKLEINNQEIKLYKSFEIKY